MLFNSLQFILFFPIVVLIYFIFPKKYKNIWLLIASYYFYMCWNAKYALLLLFSTIITYISGLFLDASGNIPPPCKLRKLTLFLSIFFNLAILFYFKYTNFFINILLKTFKYFLIDLKIPQFDILLPVGISFYIFQALGYSIDVYRGDVRAEKNFFQYALFVSFFPQLVAGPIERSKNLLKQLSTPKQFNYNNVREGLLLMLWGFFMKLVIADRCAILVNIVYGDYTSYYGFQLILANILFAFQIYCDFRSYSIIAKGSAKVLGLELMDNFSQPYLSISIKDFWRRWHISLSSWLRDYLYIPLGGNRKGKITKYTNLMITFLASGLWHGADITYIIWGGLHGLYQIVGEVTEPFGNYIKNKIKINTNAFLWKFMHIIKTFILVDIAWVFFRADTLISAIQILRNSINFSNIEIFMNNNHFDMGLDQRNMFILSFSLIILAISSLMKEAKIDVLKWLSKQNVIFRFLIYWGGILLITFSLDIVGQEFIYFQF